MKNELYSICRYIAENDRNSDIMEAWEEFLDGDLPYDVLFGILVRILLEWKEDLILNGLTKRENHYFEILGI